MHKAVRFPQLTIEQLDAPTQELAHEIIKISKSGIGGPYNVLLRSPELASKMKSLLDYLRFNTSLSLDLNEWAILIQARLWTCQIMWRSHLPLALKAGLPEHLPESLKHGQRPPNMNDKEAAVFDFCIQAAKKKNVSDKIFFKAKEILGEKPLVDLIAVSGTYVTIAMMLNLSCAPWPQGEEKPLDENSFNLECSQ